MACDKISQNYTLSARQRRLVEAILTSASLSEACAKTGVARKTAYLWLKQPGFKAALQEAQADLLAQSMRRLLTLQKTALDALEQSLVKPLTAGERLRAAEYVLNSALKFYDLAELTARIAKLEELVEQIIGKNI